MKHSKKIQLCLCWMIAVILFMQMNLVIHAGELEQLNPYGFQVSCEEKRNETVQPVLLYDIILTVKSEQKDFDGVIQIETMNENHQSVVYEKTLTLKQGEEQAVDFSCIFHYGNISYNVYAVEKKSRDIVYKQTIQKIVSVDEAELMEQMNMGMSRVTLQDMPATWTFFLTFLFYFIIAGPVLYLILKKVKHRTWIWVLLPCIAITVTVGIYIATSKTRITKPVIRSFNLIDILKDQTYVQQTEFHLLVPSNEKYHMNYKNNYRIYCNEPTGDCEKTDKNSLYNIKIRYNEKESTIYLKDLTALNEIKFLGQTEGISKFDFFIREEQIYNNTDYNFAYLFGKKGDQYYIYAPLKSGEHILQTEYSYSAAEKDLYETMVHFMDQHIPDDWEQQRQYEYITYFIKQKEWKEDYIVGITTEYEQSIFEKEQAKETGITAIRIPLSNSLDPIDDSQEERENVAD